MPSSLISYILFILFMTNFHQGFTNIQSQSAFTSLQNYPNNLINDKVTTVELFC